MTPGQRNRAIQELATYAAMIVVSAFLIAWGVL